MPNRAAKERKQARQKKNNELRINGRTASQVARTKERNETRKEGRR